MVKQLSALINLKINSTHSEAVIIANSDETRVGDFYEASKQIIDPRSFSVVALFSLVLCFTEELQAES